MEFYIKHRVRKATGNKKLVVTWTKLCVVSYAPTWKQCIPSEESIKQIGFVPLSQQGGGGLMAES